MLALFLINTNLLGISTGTTELSTSMSSLDINVRLGSHWWKITLHSGQL